MSKRAKECLAYSMIFFLGYVVACGDGKMGSGTIHVPAGVTLRMFSSSLHRPAIFPTNTGNQPVLATMFAGQLFPQAIISNPIR
jgi:hypothetical protein